MQIALMAILFKISIQLLFYNNLTGFIYLSFDIPRKQNNHSHLDFSSIVLNFPLVLTRSFLEVHLLHKDQILTKRIDIIESWTWQCTHKNIILYTKHKIKYYLLTLTTIPHKKNVPPNPRQEMFFTKIPWIYWISSHLKFQLFS